MSGSDVAPVSLPLPTISATAKDSRSAADKAVFHDSQVHLAREIIDRVEVVLDYRLKASKCLASDSGRFSDVVFCVFTANVSGAKVFNPLMAACLSAW